MSFSIDRDSGRPKGTTLTDKGIVHYTCNAPSDGVLRRYSIIPIGGFFRIEPREVLLIPENCAGQRIEADTLFVENFLRRLK